MTPYGARYEPPSGIKRKVMAQTRDSIRVAGTLTSAIRSLPDYLIIGTKRGGTTSLARWLLDHPGVRSLFPAREHRKGTYYFDVNYGRGEGWYRGHFPTTISNHLLERAHSRRLLIGEATPYYLYHPHAAARAQALVPNAKVIALLRNPIDRAHSHWLERTRQGVEHLEFEAAIDAEPERLDGEEARMIADPSYQSFAHQHWSYVDQGRYSRGLRRWMAAYPSHQIHVIRSEDLYQDPLGEFSRVVDFLGLDPHTPEELAAWNNRGRDPVDAAMRARLSGLLAEDIGEVESILGRGMDWL